MTTLEKRLAMSHIQKSDEELRQTVLDQSEEAEEKQKEAARPEPEKKDPRDEKLYTFPFKFTDLKGRTFSGTFTNQILSIGEKMNVSALESSFNGGQPYDSIEPVQQVVNRGIAHMTFSLKKRADLKPKGWADNLRTIDDEDLVLALFSEVSAHEGTFHGRTKDQAVGAPEEGDAPADS
jgi:hypothetical protein